jgi:hypothetical protein
MKKILVALSLLLTVGLTSAFASEPKVNPSVLASFKQEFSFVKDAEWTVNDEYSTAVFILADRRIVAYFSNEGEYLGSARDLIFNQLPMAVINAINKRFGDIGVYEIVERAIGAETFYYMTVEYANKILRIEATPSGSLSIIKKVRK